MSHSHEPTAEQQHIAGLDAVPPGTTVDRSTDGSVTSVVTDDDGWSVHIDPESELGTKLRRMADERDEDPGQYINEAVEAYLRGDLAP